MSEYIKILARLCRAHSGQAGKYATRGATAQEVSDILTAAGGQHRVLDIGDPKVFDDKMPTVVSGIEHLQLWQLDQLVDSISNVRFRNILIFPITSGDDQQDMTEVPSILWTR